VPRTEAGVRQSDGQGAKRTGAKGTAWGAKGTAWIGAKGTAWI